MYSQPGVQFHDLAHPNRRRSLPNSEHTEGLAPSRTSLPRFQEKQERRQRRSNAATGSFADLQNVGPTSDFTSDSGDSNPNLKTLGQASQSSDSETALQDDFSQVHSTSLHFIRALSPSNSSIAPSTSKLVNASSSANSTQLGHPTSELKHTSEHTLVLVFITLGVLSLGYLAQRIYKNKKARSHREFPSPAISFPPDADSVPPKEQWNVSKGKVPEDFHPGWEDRHQATTSNHRVLPNRPVSEEYAFENDNLKKYLPEEKAYIQGGDPYHPHLPNKAVTKPVFVNGYDEQYYTGHHSAASWTRVNR